MKSARWIFVTVGVIALTSITVDATLSGHSLSQSALGILATSVTETNTGCSDGMALIGGDFNAVCVDIYEASPGATCPSKEVANVNDTRTNINTGSCLPASTASAKPWTYVTLNQAQELCGRAGKRLLSNAEWYRASLGSPDIGGEVACNIRTDGAMQTGKYPQCVSGMGAFDMIGNVWEWVDGSVEEGKYRDRMLPTSGYVIETDADGVVTKTQGSASSDFHEDYFWSEASGVYGMLRGGFYGSGSDAGVYSLHAKTATSFAGAAIGFRCALDLKR